MADNVPAPADWSIATVTLEGRRFGIACGTDAASRDDIVADRYRTGNLRPVALVVAVARAALRLGDRVLDVGAHLGGFALAAASMGCRVLALEAAPRNARLIELSRAYNSFDDLRVRNAAVGDREGSVHFRSHGPWGQIAEAAGEGVETVPMLTIDAAIADQRWDGVEFMKLDVEGYEPRAIRGAARLLARADAPPIFFESNRETLAAFGETPESLRAAFVAHGYTVHHVRPGVLVPVGPHERQKRVVVDYLACKRVPPGLASWLRPSLRSLIWRLRESLKALRS